MSIIGAKAQMSRSLLSFCLRFFKSRAQLQLEIVYLRKQLDILIGWFMMQFWPGWTFEEGHPALLRFCRISLAAVLTPSLQDVDFFFLVTTNTSETDIKHDAASTSTAYIGLCVMSRIQPTT